MAVGYVFRAGAVAVACVSAAGCAKRPTVEIAKVSYSAQERDCLARAMYFESHRGSDDGMLAVGTVVANRVKSKEYGSTYCETVGQKRQFAPGVLTRTMEGEAAERAGRNAAAVLEGKRHAGVKGALFLHTAGRKFPYPNMHYVLVAGGNAFYEKRSAESAAAKKANQRSRALALAYASVDPTAAGKTIVVASLDPIRSPATAEPPSPRVIAVGQAPVQASVVPVQASASAGSQPVAPLARDVTQPLPPVGTGGAAASISPAPAAVVVTETASPETQR